MGTAGVSNMPCSCQPWPFQVSASLYGLGLFSARELLAGNSIEVKNVQQRIEGTSVILATQKSYTFGIIDLLQGCGICVCSQLMWLHN